ncbi:MAG: multidrug DMT transporter permease [Prevotellaceae bacterium]|jgi:glucose uptake protein|nr:multidrug DMT transporter permease [Prevotellaceae bacterium]
MKTLLLQTGTVPAALLCCLLCALCWGSWANTQKQAAVRNCSFELFYVDFVVGFSLSILLASLLPGTSSSRFFTALFYDLMHPHWNSIGYVMLSGLVWSLGNLLLIAATTVAGMAVSMSVGLSLSWSGAIALQYLLYPHQVSDPPWLLASVLFVLLALGLAAKAYQLQISSKAGKVGLGISLSLLAGIVILFFYGLTWRAVSPSYFSGAGGSMTPHSALFFFACGALAGAPLFCSFAIRYPLMGRPKQWKSYFTTPFRLHLIGWSGGIIWAIGAVGCFYGLTYAPPLLAFVLCNALAPLIAMVWGLHRWKEFKGSPRPALRLMIWVFILLVAAPVCMMMAGDTL